MWNDGDDSSSSPMPGYILKWGRVHKKLKHEESHLKKMSRNEKQKFKWIDKGHHSQAVALETQVTAAAGAATETVIHQALQTHRNKESLH